jgi:hypothetical protein
MKIIDVPSTGKQGLNVTYQSRYGLVRRAKVVPRNPKTPDQMIARQNLRACAQS